MSETKQLQAIRGHKATVANKDTKGSILQHNAIRDTIALTFILLGLPKTVSSLVFLTYILSGSSKFLGRKLISRHFSLYMKPEDSLLSEISGEAGLNKIRNYRSILFGYILQIFSINLILLAIIHRIFPKTFMKYISILAHSILASELIGIPFVSPGSTSRTSQASIPGAVSNTRRARSTSNSHNHVPDIINGKISTPSGISSFWNVLMSFCSVVYVNYLAGLYVSNMNLIQIDILFHQLYEGVALILKNLIEFSKSGNGFFCYVKPINERFSIYIPDALNRILSSNVAAQVYYYIRKWYSKMKFESMEMVFNHGIYLPCLFISRQVFRTFFVKRLWGYFLLILNWFHLVLCIIVITIEVIPLLRKIFMFRTYSKYLDDLSSLTPEVPFHFQKAQMIKSPILATPMLLNNFSMNEELNADVISISENPRFPIPDNVEIKIPADLPGTLKNQESNSTLRMGLKEVSIENFESFCMSPILGQQQTTINSVGSASKKIGYSEGIAITKNNVSVKSNNDLETSKVLTNPGTSVISNQPFWKLVAACVAMFKDPYVFSNSNVGLSDSTSGFQRVSLSAIYLDASRIVFRGIQGDGLFELLCRKSYKLEVNGILWPSYEVLESTSNGNKVAYLLVYGLSPTFQYNVVLKDETSGHKIISQYKFNTTGTNSDEVLNESMPATEITTLQSSLSTAVEYLSFSRNKLRKIKKEENKRLADAKKDIEIMKNRVAKFNTKQSNDSRTSGKIKGLHHTNLHLENTIKEMENSLHNKNMEKEAAENKFLKEEAALQNQISELTSFIQTHESAISHYRTKLRTIEVESHNYALKKEKLERKIKSREDSLYKIQNEIKQIKKNGIIGKIDMKNKRMEEKYEVILPKVFEATMDLQTEFEELLEND